MCEKIGKTDEESACYVEVVVACGFQCLDGDN